MPNDNNSFPILGHSVLHCVEKLYFNNVVETLQDSNDLIQIPPILIEQTPDILKDPDVRVQPHNRRNEHRKAVSGVMQAKLMSTDAEGLAGWPTDDDLGFWQWRVYSKPHLFAVAEKILPVCGSGIGVHLEAERGEAVGFKSERKPTTTRKQVQNKRLPIWFGPKKRVDPLSERLCHLEFVCADPILLHSDVSPAKAW